MRPAFEAPCSDISRAAAEPLPGTAATVDRWLLIEVPGAWPRDVGAGQGLPPAAAEAVARWADNGRERRRVIFVRRPGRRAERRLVFTVLAAESAVEVRRLELARLEELADADLERGGSSVEGPLVLVCGHGSRDACCARRGTAVYGALEDGLGPEQLWLSSHQGGHRFAANVLVLPGAVQLGRVEPVEAPSLVGAVVDGRLPLDHYRGRTCYPPAVQAAEHAVRLHHGLTRVADLALAGVDGEVVRFRGPGDTDHAAHVVEREGPAVPASCGAPPEAQPVLVATLR